MRQQTLAEGTFEVYAQPARRGVFLAGMERIAPWSKLCVLIARYEPKGECGRPTGSLERMLRLDFLCRGSWGSASGARRSTLLRFRRLLETHGLGPKIIKRSNQHLEAHGMAVSRGTLVDATILSAPSTTRNREQSQGPDMHQARKGNQWYFDMKARVGVDSKTRPIHPVEGTATHAADSRVLPELLQGRETRVWGDHRPQRQTEAIERRAPRTRDLIHRRCRDRERVDEVDRAKNRTKSRVRAPGGARFFGDQEHLRLREGAHEGLGKNAHRLFVTCAVANLYFARRDHFVGSKGEVRLKHGGKGPKGARGDCGRDRNPSPRSGIVPRAPSETPGSRRLTLDE